MSRSLDYSSIKPKVPIILASGSESRRQMLQEAGITFNVVVSNTDEEEIKQNVISKPFEDQAIYLAKAKAEPVSKIHSDSIVIGGDQMCVHN